MLRNLLTGAALLVLGSAVSVATPAPSESASVPTVAAAALAAVAPANAPGPIEMEVQVALETITLTNRVLQSSMAPHISRGFCALTCRPCSDGLPCPRGDGACLAQCP